MKIILFLFIGLLFLLVLIIAIGKIVNARKYRISSEAGVQKSEYITIGGIEQYIQIRGQDISNPVILMLHGGPGSNMAYYSYGWQADLEKAYTIVQWDQRGCGNTYYRNKHAEKPTLDLLLSDLDELTEYIRLEYGKEKVIIMGQSWGTFLGGVYSGKHPEKVSAYIAVGQMVDFKLSEQVSAQEAIRLANTAGKTQDAQDIGDALDSIMAFQKLDMQNAMELMKFRQLKEKYLPSQNGDKMGALQIFSPYMTLSEWKWMLSFDSLIESNSEIYKGLLSENNSSVYDYSLQYEIPVIIIAGDCDWTTPYSMALDYFNNISSPGKEFITIGNTGHIPFVDKSKEFSEKLMNALNGIPVN